MMGGMRGLHSGGMNSPTMDNLSDDNAMGSVYNNKVVMRLITYMGPYKPDVIKSLAAVLVYTIANASIPLLIMLGINHGINSGETSSWNLLNLVSIQFGTLTGGFWSWHPLHLFGLGFLVITLIHFGASYLQFVFMARVGQSILYSLRTQMFSHLQDMSPSFYHRTAVGRIMSRS